MLEAAKARPDVLVQVGLEYRYIPAVAELLAQVKQRSAVGKVRMVAIREHRFPFLVKVRGSPRLSCFIITVRSVVSHNQGTSIVYVHVDV